MSDEADADAADTMRERVDESRLKLRVILEANRLLLAGVLTAAVFFAFVIAVAVLRPPFAQQIASGDTIETLFSTMILFVVTGTTLVVTIGQLILTQENGPLGDQHDRMSNSMNVRKYTEELIGSPNDADPAAFLGDLLGAAVRRSETLRESVDGTDGDALGTEIRELTESVIENADGVRQQLEDAQFGTFDVLSAALDFNYGRKIVRLEHIADEYEGRLTERERDSLDELKAALSLYAPAREHVKTLYFQWTLIDLSRQILYASIPAIAVSGIMTAVVDAGTFPGSALGIDHITWVVGGAFAVTLFPFMLFVSYVLRILTVAKHTLAIEPLILRDSRR